MKKFFYIFIFISISGCTAVNVEKVDKILDVEHVCIQENQKVIVGDFLGVVRDGFDRHGISTEVFYDNKPEHCNFVLTYTALQSWDFATYLAHAELRLEKNGKKVAYAEYHLRGKGGLSLMKWQGTKTKINPVMDELLEEYKENKYVANTKMKADD